MDYQNLEAFAERSRRADEQTALIGGVPPLIERGVIYLVIAVLLITVAILYFGRVQTVVETRGTIAPGGASLMVETSVSNRDIGFVRPGVTARIKVDAFPYQQFGTARAQVVKVLPAAGTSSSFVVQLDLLDQALTIDGSEHRLFPGLTVQADLVTGRQRLLDVLFHGRAGGAAPEK